MKTSAILVLLTLGTGCSDTDTESTSTVPKPTALTAPLRLGDQVLGQLDVQMNAAEDRKRRFDEGLEADQASGED